MTKRQQRRRDERRRAAAEVQRASDGAVATRTRRVQKGRVSPPRTVPPEIVRPPYARPAGALVPVHPPGSFTDRMRAAGRAAAHVLAVLRDAVAPGRTTDELDALAHDAYIALGGYPSTLHY